ncbi:MAG: hypothetical protein ACRC5T_09005 [Cetobacterium sp.]
MELEVIKDFGLMGSGVVLLFFIFKKSMEETLKQNNDMMSHLMTTNKQLHNVSVDMSNKFNVTVEEHTKAIQDLRNEIRKMNQR